MKRTLLCLCAILVFSLYGCSSAQVETGQIKESDIPASIAETSEPPAVEPVFRNVYWGMPKDEVMKSEDSELIDGSAKGALLYQSAVLGLDATLFYQFNDNDELCDGAYFLAESHTNENLYIEDYEKVCDALTDKYGPPKQDKDEWSDDLFKDDPTQYGFAISIGHYSKMALWETTDSKISIHLNGDNYEIQTVLLYTSTTVDQPEKKGDGGI